MLIGQSPFNGCDEDELFWSICNEQPFYPKFITKEAIHILIKVMSSYRIGRFRKSSCHFVLGFAAAGKRPIKAIGNKVVSGWRRVGPGIFLQHRLCQSRKEAVEATFQTNSGEFCVDVNR